jgi:hypothetical protein
MDPEDGRRPQPVPHHHLAADHRLLGRVRVSATPFSPCFPQLWQLERTNSPFHALPCSKSLYTIWASIAFVWGYMAAIIIIALPIIESWSTIINVLTCNTSKKQAAASAASETAKA